MAPPMSAPCDYGTCDICETPMHAQSITQDFWLRGELVVLEHVPAGVCPQCGATGVNTESGRRIAALLGNPFRIAQENPSWGEERIANKLLLKLGLRVSPRTVRKYMPKRGGHGRGQPVAAQRWMIFVRNHAQTIVACDFCVVATAAFRFLYVFVVMEHATRRILHTNITAHPTASWTLQQLREAFPLAMSTDSCCMTVIVSSLNSLIRASTTWGCGCSRRRCGLRKRMPRLSDSILCQSLGARPKPVGTAL
jgi:YgiT-type zinc finger domain-containing protein